MFKNILNKRTEKVFKLISASKLINSNFYLAGGTALAWQFGHRQSIDLDFFSLKNFSNQALKKELSKIGKIKIMAEDEGTLHVILNQVKISFLHYPYPLLFKPIKVENIKLADWRDIMAMKISAVANRGSKKDFIDTYFILQKISLNNLFKVFDKKYKHIKYNQIHILKSLIYFTDAEQEPLPKMLESVSWFKVKNEIRNKVEDYLKK